MSLAVRDSDMMMEGGSELFLKNNFFLIIAKKNLQHIFIYVVL